MGREPRLDPDNNVRPEGPQIMKGETRLLDDMELGTLKGMAVYWREIFERDEPECQYILASELRRVIRFIRSEKILRIIAAYVEGRS